MHWYCFCTAVFQLSAKASVCKLFANKK